MQFVTPESERKMFLGWSTMRYFIALALALTSALLILRAGRGRGGTRKYTSSDSIFLQGLPLPDYPLGLDLDARFNLLFGSVNTSASGNGEGAGRRTHSRLVVLPDLHGDGPQALQAMRLAGLVSEETPPGADNDTSTPVGRRPWPVWRWRWSGGDALLVQLGDVVDRGHDSLALLGLMEMLRMQARAVGGDVVALLGNHELMNVYHDFRYVAPTELIALAEAHGVPAEWGTPSGAAATVAAAADDATASRTAAARSGDGRQLAGDAGGGEDGDDDSCRRDEGQCGIGGAWEEAAREEELLLRAETLSVAVAEGQQRQRSAAADRELLYDGNGGGDGAIGCSPTREDVSSQPLRGSKAVAGDRRRNVLQHQHGGGQQQQQLLLSGLDTWRQALAPGAQRGRLIRQRPLAVIADAGGCRILAVHAGVFPWMLRAVDKLLLGAAPGAQYHAHTGEGGGVGEAKAEIVPGGLRPEQYVAAWNNAVAAALAGCEGRACRLRGGRDQYERSRAALADLLLGGEGAVWSRRYMRAASEEMCDEVAVVLRRLAVERIVVGHTVQRGGRVRSRCHGQLLMADVGLSRAISGELAVLQCADGSTEILYGGGQVERLQ